MSHTTNAGIASPIFVDLDGMLVLSDSLWESFLVLLRIQPRKALSALRHLLRGIAAFKREVAEAASFPAEILPLNKDLVEYLRQEAAMDRRIYLITGADESIARAVAGHLGFFSGVFASNRQIN